MFFSFENGNRFFFFFGRRVISLPFFAVIVERVILAGRESSIWSTGNQPR